jgi:hypothetical protein
LSVETERISELEWRTRRTWFSVALAAGVDEKVRDGSWYDSAIDNVGRTDCRAIDGHMDRNKGDAILSLGSKAD